MSTPDRERATDRLANTDLDRRRAPDAGSPAVPRESATAEPAPSLAAERPARWRHPATRPRHRRMRTRFRPHLGALEPRALLSTLPTLTAVIASTSTSGLGQSITFTATVEDLTAGGRYPLVAWSLLATRAEHWTA
jgi:hypothetical protein